MKIAIMAQMGSNLYSGGRYHAYIMAECLAHTGNDVTLIINSIPSYYDDFCDYPYHKKVNIVTTKNFAVDPDSLGLLDYLILVPSQDKKSNFYTQCIGLSLKTHARLVLLNFESANWFNSVSPWKRDESLWDQWKRCCRYGCLVLSSAQESMKYAKELYTDYKKYTRFDYWHPAINSLAADSINTMEKENRIVVFVRLGDVHKGSSDIFKIINQDMKGYRIVFISGTGDINNEFIKKLNEYAESYHFQYEIRTKISDKEKFVELKKAKIVLFPSYFEGYGYPPVEAQYCECVCLAYDMPVLREINKDGIVYCEYGNPSDMKERLGVMLHDMPNNDELKKNILDKGDFQTRAMKLHQMLQSHKDDDWRNPWSKIIYPVDSFEKKLIVNAFSHLPGMPSTTRIKRYLINVYRHLISRKPPVLSVWEAVYHTEKRVLKISGYALGIHRDSLISVRIVGTNHDGLTEISSRPVRRIKAPGYHVSNTCAWSYEARCEENLVGKTATILLIIQGVSTKKKTITIKSDVPECLTLYEGKPVNPDLPNILISSHVIIEPNIQGNRVYINKLIDFLMSSGECNVFLLIQARKRDVDPHISAISSKVHKFFIADLDRHQNFSRKKKCAKIDRYFQGTEDSLLHIERNYGIYAIIAQYAQMCSSMEMLADDITRIVCTHDVQHRFKGYEKYGIIVDQNRQCTREEEIKLLDFADVIAAITPFEQAILKEMLPHKKIIVAGCPFELSCKQEKAAQDHTLLFFGSRNELNVRGVTLFLQQAWPAVREACPDAVFQIAGSICDALNRHDTQQAGVELMGVLDAEALAEAKERCQVLLNCTDLGTGLKIKTLEALAACKPLVSTPRGVEGLQYDPDARPFLVAEDWPAFCSAILALFHNPEKCRELAMNARKFSLSALTPGRVYAEFLGALRAGPLNRGNDAARRYTRSLMESVPRLKLTGKLAVLVTDDLLFSRYVIDYLIDNSLQLQALYAVDSKLQACLYRGYKIFPLDHKEKESLDLCIIPTKDRQNLLALDEALWEQKIPTLNFLSEPSWMHRMRMLAYKDKHAGEEAFILGNGPSVRIEDLDRLTGKLVFIANRFHKAYAQTSLRGTYTASSDILMIEEFGREIALHTQSPYFVQARGAHHVCWPSGADVIEYGLVPRPEGPDTQVAFSEDLTQGVGNGGSIIYELIQIAVWMGVRKIYLYGMDHSFAMPPGYSGKQGSAVRDAGESNHFIKEYRSGSGIWYSPVTELIDKAFAVAKEYCDKHGIEIYNISRGGALEAFPRLEFEKAVQL